MQQMVQSGLVAPVCRVCVYVYVGVAGAKADDGGVSQETFNSFLLPHNGTFGIQ